MKDLYSIKEAIKFLNVDEKVFKKMKEDGDLIRPKIIGRKHYYTKQWLENAKEKRFYKIKEKFLENARRIYDNKYYYTYMNYVSMHEKISIECQEHGFFKVAPIEHVGQVYDPYCNRNFQPKECPRCEDERDIKNLLLEFNDYDGDNIFKDLHDLQKQMKTFKIVQIRQEYEKKYFVNKYKRMSWKNFLVNIGADKLMETIINIRKIRRYLVFKSYLSNLDFYINNFTKKQFLQDIENSLSLACYKKFTRYNIGFILYMRELQCLQKLPTNGLVAMYNKTLSVQPTKKNKENPINVLYIWEALDFEDKLRVVKIGTTRSYRGMKRIEEVAETWNTKYKLLMYEIVENPILLEQQLLYIGNKYFTESRLADGATEFRIVTENDLAKIFSIIDKTLE